MKGASYDDQGQYRDQNIPPHPVYINEPNFVVQSHDQQMYNSQQVIRENRGVFCCCSGSYRTISLAVMCIYVFIWALTGAELFISLSYAGGSFWVEHKNYKYIAIIPFVGASIPLVAVAIFQSEKFSLKKFRLPFKIIMICSYIVFPIGIIACTIGGSLAHEPTFNIIFGSLLVLIAWIILQIFCFTAIQSESAHNVRIVSPVNPIHENGMMPTGNPYYVSGQQRNCPQTGGLPVGSPIGDPYN